MNGQDAAGPAAGVKDAHDERKIQEEQESR